MVVAPLSDNRLPLADLDAIASATAPTLTHGPGTRLGGSSARKERAEPVPVRHSRRTAAHRASERPPIVSRRLRRLVNDRALHMAAADIGALPTSRSELRALFERHSRTIFSRLHDDDTARAAFAPYIDENLDDDGDNDDDDGDGDGDGEGMGKGGMKPKQQAQQGVDQRIRRLSKQRPHVVKPLIQQIEESVLHLDYGESIALHLPHPLARMVAHAVAQFHCLAHRSCDVGAQRVLVIRRKHLDDHDADDADDTDEDDNERGRKELTNEMRQSTAQSQAQSHLHPQQPQNTLRLIDILA